MTYACFITINGSAEMAGRVRARVESHIIPAFRQRGRANFVSLFAPVPGRDETPSALVIQIEVDDLEHAKPLFADAELMGRLADTATCDAFETLSYPIDGVADPALRTAPVSFNVRYFAPVEDEKRFVEHYLASHPPIMAELPGVRNVLCYVPVSWDSPLPVSNCILGNEVTFDSVDALNDALASDARLRLRADYDAFPVRPGRNTHHAMHRRDFRINQRPPPA